MRYFVIDCSRLSDRDAAQGYIKARLGFPEYYGGNLDALADCLGEFCSGATLILVAPELAGDYGKRMLAVIGELADDGVLSVNIRQC